MAEAGLPGYDANFWSGLVAPAGTPRDAIERLNGVLVKALATPEVREALARQGLEAFGTSPGEFAKYIATEIEKWGRVVKASGAKVD
jgi:tripartite-type tricarboxylate transporter receptor subunit TctC